MASCKKITLVKSLIGSTPEQRATAQAIGLRKIGDTVILPNDPDTAGMIKMLGHLIAAKPVREENLNGRPADEEAL